MATADRKLIRQVRERAKHVRDNASGLYVPRTEGDKPLATWPVCMTCKQDVDSVNVEDVSKDTVTIRAKCHGEEAVIKVEFPYAIRQRDETETMHHVQNAMNSATFFDPSIA